jgi:mannose-6-phosphate isomerase-like protein (cupin superfamily)
MLHGECESFDYVWLAPGTEFALRGREGTESAWFVLSGSGRLLGTGPASQARTLEAGELLLVPAGRQEELRLASGAEGLELLWLAVMPRDITRALPPRRPVA